MWISWTTIYVMVSMPNWFWVESHLFWIIMDFFGRVQWCNFYSVGIQRRRMQFPGSEWESKSNFFILQRICIVIDTVGWWRWVCDLDVQVNLLRDWYHHWYFWVFQPRVVLWSWLFSLGLRDRSIERWIWWYLVGLGPFCCRPWLCLGSFIE